ncbi:GNAT family N-acetyltransferase [Streptomyces fragilis]|uniref:GNAT family N-acetyltransferase n=1 Tax=Streptomyces fragilis TaxID=67301 RepID=A0ABV2YPE8_9ACTN|nr:GNAT family N-acetyltransferase [Streptomyces fragilis]
MSTQKVTLRQMTPAEYAAATEHREAETARALGKFMPDDLAGQRAREGTEQFLPDGLHTPGHHLVVAENASGDVVGNAWIGPDPRQAAGTADSAWLYDINVFPSYRRHGYGSALLAAAEELVAREGRTSLNLNVVGDNTGAIALYRSNGYEVASMYLSKDLRP